MGLRLSFGFGPLRVSLPLTRRRRSRRRTTISRYPTAKTFHGVAPLADGSVFRCHHEHRTEQAAVECAAKYKRDLARKGPTPMPGEHSEAEVAYAKKYDELIEAAFSELTAVDTLQMARRFIMHLQQQVHKLSREVPEFYAGEFLNLFKDVVVGRFRAEMVKFQGELEAARSEADATSADLTAHLNAARNAGDRAAEHSVWKEREVRQAACQSKIDAITHRISLVSLRIDTCKKLADALGFSL